MRVIVTASHSRSIPAEIFCFARMSSSVDAVLVPSLLVSGLPFFAHLWIEVDEKVLRSASFLRKDKASSSRKFKFRYHFFSDC